MPMHPIDQAIFDNTLTPAMLHEEAKKELPPPGTSYWGDAMRELAIEAAWLAPVDLPRRAAKRAAAAMGQAHATILGLQTA